MSEVDRSNTNIELAVAERIDSDKLSGAARVRLGPGTMKAHGLFAGDLVRLCKLDSEGEKSVSFASVWPSSSIGSKIWLPEKVYLNCQASVGEKVWMERISHIPDTACNVVLEFPVNHVTYSLTEDLVKKELADIGYVHLDQYVDINILGMPYRLQVKSIEVKQDRVLLSKTECTVFSFEKTSITIRDSQVGDTGGAFQSQPTLESIGGLVDETKAIGRLVEAALVRPELYTRYRLRPPRGALLYGPPGTGKTLLVRAVAKSSNIFFSVINGAETMNKYYGESEKAISAKFAEARERSPSIIFIDEIDALCPKRSESDSEASKRMVATLLTLMDGTSAETLDRVFVIGATNRPNSIDPALRRPGRFDQEIEIPIPDRQARLSILNKKLGCMPNSLTDEQRRELAANLHGFVGADIEALVREAGIHAIRNFEAAERRCRITGSGISLELLKVDYSDFCHAIKSVKPSSMREVMLEIPNVSWNDIGGQQDTKTQLKEAVDWPLNHAKAFRRLGIRPPKGVLLYGPPGCSKTLTAKALATEAKVNFIAVRGPELFSKWVGESEKAVRDLFRKARAAAPSIVFFDEIDALTVSRGSSGEGTSVADRVLSQLLTELDGIEPLVEVTVVAATNMLENIDPAILRPGRIDRKIYVGLPDSSTRKAIFDIQFRKMACGRSMHVDRLVEMTDGFSGAEVVSLCQEAGMKAMSENPDADCVEMKHFEECRMRFRSRISPEALEYDRRMKMELSWQEKIKQVEA